MLTLEIIVRALVVAIIAASWHPWPKAQEFDRVRLSVWPWWLWVAPFGVFLLVSACMAMIAGFVLQLEGWWLAALACGLGAAVRDWFRLARMAGEVAHAED